MFLRVNSERFFLLSDLLKNHYISYMTLVRFTIVSFVLCLGMMLFLLFKIGRFPVLDGLSLVVLGINIALQLWLNKRLGRVPFSWGFYGINILYLLYFLTTTRTFYDPFISYTRVFEMLGLESPQEIWFVFFSMSFYAFFTSALLELVIVALFLAKYREIKIS